MALPEHVCFDKDGTLTEVHSYWAYTCSIRARALAERFGLPSESETGLLRSMGIVAGRIQAGGPVGYKPRVAIVRAVAEHLELPAERIAEVFAEVDRRQQATNDFRVTALPGVREALVALKTRGFKLSVYTSDRAENARRALGLAGLSEFFDVIVGGDSVRQPKPDPEGLLIACRQVGIDARRTVYVSDTVDDLKMAAAGGALPIGVATGVQPLAELRGGGWIALASMGELEAALSGTEIR